MSKITKSWKTLTEAQMLGWDHLAEHTSGQSVFGQAAQISGLNLYIRLNVSRTMAGESILHDAPEQLVFLPNVVYDKLWVTTKNIVIKGITHEAGYKLVIKMSATPSTSTVDIAADYAAKHGAPSAAAPKIFFRYYLVNSATGEKSGTILAECKWTAGE